MLNKHIVSHVLGPYLGLYDWLVFHLQRDVFSLTFQNVVDGCCRRDWCWHLASWSQHLAQRFTYLRHEGCFGDEKVVLLSNLPGLLLVTSHLVQVFLAYDDDRASVFGPDCEIAARDDCDLYRLASCGWEFE